MMNQHIHPATIIKAMDTQRTHPAAMAIIMVKKNLAATMNGR